MKKLVVFRSPHVSRLMMNCTFDDLWHSKAEKVIKEHKTSDVVRIVIKTDDRAKHLNGYRKRYWYLGIKGSMRGCFRNTFFGRSRAHAEYRSLSYLHALGLSEVVPVAYGEDRTFRLLRRAMIVTEALPDTHTLDTFLESDAFQHATTTHRRIFVCTLGRWIAQMHNRGYKDRDMFARNILVHATKSNWRFSKIDAASATVGRRSPCCGSPFIKDLRDLNEDLGLHMNRTDRLRCLLAYTASGTVDRHAKKIIHSIL